MSLFSGWFSRKKNPPAAAAPAAKPLTNGEKTTKAAQKATKNFNNDEHNPFADTKTLLEAERVAVAAAAQVSSQLASQQSTRINTLPFE